MKNITVFDCSTISNPVNIKREYFVKMAVQTPINQLKDPESLFIMFAFKIFSLYCQVTSPTLSKKDVSRTVVYTHMIPFIIIQIPVIL